MIRLNTFTFFLAPILIGCASSPDMTWGKTDQVAIDNAEIIGNVVSVRLCQVRANPPAKDKQVLRCGVSTMPVEWEKAQ